MKYFLVVVISVLYFVGISNGIENVKYSKSFKLAENGTLDDYWWDEAVMYQVYPRSFKDSDNDGNGDLQGVIQKLDYFTDMGIDGIWLASIFKSPQVDNGYDISDYRDVDDIYGSLADLRQLIDEAHERNIKVIVDYVPNHTSDQHEWFQASLKGISPYDEYYIWRNATYVDGERKPPNNWVSSFRGSSWEWSEERQQYYYHQFSPAQPDLNYRNPEVVKEMEDVLTYWLNFGVDGFRMDAVQNLVEDDLLRDEPSSGLEGLDPDDPDNLDHIYTMHQNDTFDLIYQWRTLLDEFSIRNNTYTRLMVTEVYSDVLTAMRYSMSEDFTRHGAHFSLNFASFILDSKKGFNAIDLFENISAWMHDVPGLEPTINWVLGNHDQPRLATRLGVENIDGLNILAAILPGVLVTYQGEEIGQENGEVTCEQGYDPRAIKNCTTFGQLSRDFERTPFQWDNSTNAGFNKGNTTWLPVSAQYPNTNLALQNTTETNSHYKIYKKILQIKREYKSGHLSIQWGADGEDVFMAQRISNSVNYFLLFNTGDSERTFSDIGNFTLEVAVTSLNSQYRIGDVYNSSQPLIPKEIVVMKVTKN